MNILIVGLGSIASKHIKAIKNLGFNPLFYALRSGVIEGEINGIINIFNLEDESINFDFAIISNPTIFHEKFIRILATKNIPLFIEKPPISSLEHFAELKKIINENNLKTYVACNLRFHPCLQFLKNFLLKVSFETINEVNVYCGSYLPEWRPSQDFRNSYSANPELGGGVHLDLYHELDYTYWLFGNPISVSSIKRSNSTLKIDSVDYANYSLEYSGFTSNVILNYYRRDPKRIIEIVFNDSTLIVDLIKNNVSDQKGFIYFSEKSDFQIQTTYENQMNFFIKMLDNEAETMNTFADSENVLKICLTHE